MQWRVLFLLMLMTLPAWAEEVEVGIQALERGDYAAVFNEFRPLAERGNPAAQFNLGVMYANGQGVPRDDAEAARWFHKAAVQGYANAQRNLGVIYILGRGVPQDYVRGYLWSELSAAQGDRDSALLRDTMMKEMTPEQIAEAKEMAKAWKPK